MSRFLFSSEQEQASDVSVNKMGSTGKDLLSCVAVPATRWVEASPSGYYKNKLMCGKAEQKVTV